MSNVRYRLLGATGVFVFAAGISPARAQDIEIVSAPSVADAATLAVDSNAGLDDIIVTAQKREESLQDTPLSIAALGSAQLEARGIRDMRDLGSGVVPSLRIVPANSGRPAAFNVAMRGIVPSDPTQISRDGTVAIYLDGVYLGRSQGLSGDLLDLERIEVLRGPQGTLFGRNAVGGAISLVSKRPSGRFDFTQTFGLRNYDGFNSITRLNLPEFANFSVKLEASYSKRGGVVDNPAPGESDWSAYKRKGARASVLWEPTNNFSALYSFDISRDESVSSYGQLLQLYPTTVILAPIIQPEPNRVRTARTGVPLSPNIGKISGHSLNALWNATDNLDVRSITAFRRVNQTFRDNSAGALLAFVPGGITGRESIGGTKQHQFTEEVQLLGDFDNLNFVLGGFYFKEKASDFAYTDYTNRYNETGTETIIQPAPTGGAFPDRASRASAESIAFFGQMSYSPPILAERLTVTLGLRHTEDRKSGRLVELAGNPSALSYKFKWKRWDPAATLAFQAMDNVNTYVRWGTAYRAGAADSRSATFRTFGPEEVESWELGLKTELFDRRVRLNLAAYTSKYKDIQITFVNPLNTAASETLNGTRPATIKGIEADLTVKAFRALTMTANYTYTDAHLPRQPNPFSGELIMARVIYTPEHAASLSADYEFHPFSFGQLSAHVDAIYSGGYYSQVNDVNKSKQTFLLNGRLTLADIGVVGDQGNLAVSLWGKNLTKSRYDINDFNIFSPGVNNYQLGWLNEPRTYGVEVTFRY